MQSNNQERITEDAATCEVCGSGHTPDERMNFEGKDIEAILQAAHRHLEAMHDSYLAAECCLAKVIKDMAAIPV